MAATLGGQVAVVTGGGRGIGAAIAERLAQLGASVVICGRDQKTLDAAAKRIAGAGGKCEAVVCDVRDLCSVENLAEHVEKTFGRIDVLVNNAGVGAFRSPLHQFPPEEWDAVMETNLRGPYYMIREFAPMMISAQSGHIINISSLAGKNPVPNGAAYAASKWGLNGLSYTVAEELRSHKIRVTVVCPGSTASELRDLDGRDSAKIMHPSDIAHVVEMLVTQAPQSFVSEVLIRPTQKPK